MEVYGGVYIGLKGVRERERVKESEGEGDGEGEGGGMRVGHLLDEGVLSWMQEGHDGRVGALAQQPDRASASASAEWYMVDWVS